MPKTKTKPRVRAKNARPVRRIKVQYSFKVEGELNISALVARQKINSYLLMRVPNLIGAGEPELQLRPKGAFWIVPVFLTMPGIGRVGQVGQIVVDAHNGDIIANGSTSCEEIEKNADRLVEEKAL